MTNPFEDESATYLVLINDEGQYSLWPTFRAIPAGWSQVGPIGSRQECIDRINKSWVDMRPKSLIEQMQKAEEARKPK